MPKYIIHFTHPSGYQDEFHLEGEPEKVREVAKHNLESRKCDLSLVWSEEVYDDKSFTKV
jgi:hypothetical protein